MIELNYGDDNRFSGELPPELGNLTSLKRLAIYNSPLVGEIPPELGDLTNLQVLDLHGNELSGEIPPELGNLANLQSLSLGDNQLSGEIPPELGNLTNLQHLSLGDQLSGEIPPELGNLINLRGLYIIENQLSGEIPRELGNLVSLEVLDLSENQLSGELPPELGNLTNLQSLRLYGNRLTGCIPASPPPSLGGVGSEHFCPTQAQAATEVPATQAQVPTEVPATQAQVPTVEPAPTAAPTRAPTEAPPPTPAMSLLERYAAEHAGGPGAIYVGDLSQLVGPAPDGIDGEVTLGALERHRWIYESDYYKELLEKANLTNPTPLYSSRAEITNQHACINRDSLPCVLLQEYFATNLSRRTNGQAWFVFSSFQELGLAATDTLQFVRDGTLYSATVHGAYVGDQIPAIEMQNLPGIYSSSEQEFEAAQSIVSDIEELVQAETRGVIMNHDWYAGGGWFLYCKRPINSLKDFEGRKIGYHSPSLADWLEGMGAEGQLYDPGDTFYTPLERGIVDCALAEAWEGYSHRLVEVTDYLIGPLSGSFNFASNVINPDAWRRIPQDLQQIILEEAAKSELEALRLAAIQNETGLQRNRDEGLVFIPLSDEMKRQSFTVAMEHVIPGWVQRAGGPGSPIITDTFNNKVGPLVGLRIRSDGTVVRIN